MLARHRIAFFAFPRPGSCHDCRAMTLEMQNVTYRVGAETHIHETRLTLDRGRFNILLGTTLAGKTTLMQMMAGLRQPTTGRILFDGRDVTGRPVQKRNIAMVYQQFINYPNLSVYENIASPLRVARLARAQIDDRVRATADMLKLTPMLSRRPHELSGGQQQRTALARALVKDADMVLLDEPLANLDYKLREELRDELPRLFADRNCVVVYATTEPREALLFGGWTATMHQGRVTQFGPTTEIYRRPGDLISARVFSDPPINIAEVEKSGGDMMLNNAVRWPADRRLASLPDGRYTLALRPHHVTLSDSRPDAVPIEGEVLVSEISGSESVIHFEMNGVTWVSQSHGIYRIEVGSTARLFADMSRCMLFGENQELIAA